MAVADQFNQWSSNIDHKIDGLGDKIDEIKNDNIELWQKTHEEIRALNAELFRLERAPGQRLAVHATELSNWRWSLLICLGMVITAVMNFVIANHSIGSISDNAGITNTRVIH